MKFKVGDRVIIDPPKHIKETALSWWTDIGKTATIVAFNDEDLYGEFMHFVSIYVDNSGSYVHQRANYRLHWNIDPAWLKPVDIQMVFPFMRE